MQHTDSLNALLAGYAGGTLPAPVHVLIGSHLELTPRNRRFVSDLETAAGTLIETLPPVPLSRRDERLAAIFDEPVEPRAHSLSSAVNHSIDFAEATSRMPAALRRFVGRDLADVAWKSKLPGLKAFEVGEFDGCKASLFWISAGRPMPSHTHHGSELTLVLEGGFSDHMGHYVRGDVALADEDIDHKPRADDDGDCICFAVTDAPLRPTGPILRFLAPFLRR